MNNKIIAGNWKMYKSWQEATKYADEIKSIVSVNELSDNVDLLIFPPFLYIQYYSDAFKNSKVHIGAQNCHNESQGAYTGEVSANMIRSIGATHVIIGHSERRQYFNEFNSLLEKKIHSALFHGLNVIYCCGETLEQRKSNLHFDTVEKQIKEVLSSEYLNDYSKKIAIAYEPVWAIGTGKNATPDQAVEMHQFIRNTISDIVNEKIAKEFAVLYGGSVKPENASEYFSNADINGALIGGACLDPNSFMEIYKAMN